MKTRNAHLRGSDRKCPKCGNERGIITRTDAIGGHGPGLAACGNCGSAWEFFTEDKLLDPEPCSSFTEPCNNCAFRKGSPEQDDPYLWMKIKEGVEAAEPFYCHKGVPITPNVKNGFAYPERTVTMELAGHRVETKVPDQSKLRMCRGWLNSRFAQIRKEAR